MTTAHEISHTLQLMVTVRLLWHIPGCADRDSQDKEAASFSRVLPHVISSSMAELMTLAAARCLHLACNHWPRPKLLPIHSFQSVFCALCIWHLAILMEAGKICFREEVLSVFFNRHSWCCLSNYSSVADLWARLGVATLWIIALNTGSTEGGCNKAAL